MVNGKQAIKMPNKVENVQFNNYHKQLKVPFVIYADFKAIIEKIHQITHIQMHKDCSYAYKVVCCYDDQYSKQVQMYRGENAVYKFIERVLEEEKWYQETVKKHFNNHLIMTEECHICIKECFNRCQN